MQGRRKLVSKRPAERNEPTRPSTPTPSSSTTAHQEAAPAQQQQRAANRDYHFSVRKCIRQTMEDAQFVDAVTSLKTQLSTTADVVTLEALLNPLCIACDAACEQHPTTAPIQVTSLTDWVTQAVTDTMSEKLKSQTVDSSVDATPLLRQASATFATIFVSKVLPFLVKIEVAVPTVPLQQSHSPPPPPPPPPASAAGDFRPAKFVRTEVHPSSKNGSSSSTSLFQTPEGVTTMSEEGSLLAAPKALPSVLPSPPIQPPHPKCVTRCVTFDNVPAHLCTKDGLRPQLNNICSWNQERFFLNTEVILSTPFSENFSEDSILQTGKVVVSLSTTEAADDLIQRINFQSFVDHSPIIARESTAEERDVIWGPRRAQIETLQEATVASLQKFEETNPRAIRSFRAEALAEMKRIDAQLAQESLPDTERLQLMRNKFDVVQVINNANKSLTDLREPLEGPTETFSSSSATITNSSALLFVGNLPPEGLSDSRLLLLLKPFTESAIEGLWIQLVHVWRDPQNATRVCCALQSIGQVFAVLRALDATDFQFCGATFSRSRPS